MKTGTIKFFNSEKGFGFIVPDEGGRDIFVHKTGQIANEMLKEEDKVQYKTKEGKKGLEAFDVEVI